MSFTGLDGLNEFSTSRGSVIRSLAGNGLCQNGTLVLTGSMGFPLSRGRERLESFLRQSGMARLRPLNPLRQTTPSVLKHPKTFALGMSGRADAGFPPGIRKPAPARLIRSYGLL